ncbi:MAG: zf-HC2 domain-containing protein [Planctomycetota bacterium]|nr:zf-HC2 domain-containing protein [Planctomycetota bacterium]
MDSLSASLTTSERPSGKAKAVALSCAESRELLSQYAAGSLESGLTDLVDRHLEGCDACARELIAMRKEDDLLTEALSDLKPNASFRARVSDLCEQVHRSAEGIANSIPQRSWTAFRWTFAALSVAIFAGLSLIKPPQPEALNIVGAESIASADRTYFFWINASIFALALFLLLGSTLVSRLEGWIGRKVGHANERGASRLEVLTLEAMGICGVLAASVILFFIRS